MAVKCTKLDRSGRARIADFYHRLVGMNDVLSFIDSKRYFRNEFAEHRQGAFPISRNSV